MNKLADFDNIISPKNGQNLVIVIDPGHGGSNQGALYDGYIEKEMTLTVALAMRDELLQYEQVEVYLTHETDVDMSIKDRADFAAQKNADFLFCLHFNTSKERNYFGAEVWVPAEGEYYAKGYSFAQIEMQDLTDTGLYSRGIKTRLGDFGKDYYGILRYCTQKSVPSVLIEHCHLDHEKDKGFYQQGDEQLRELGRLDATAVAKYFGLKSERLGVDFSGYAVPKTQVPAQRVAPDRTEPNLCRIETTEIREDTGEITLHMEAEDAESYILYYGCSIDGGKTWLPLEEWPRPHAWNESLTEYDFTLTVPFDQKLLLLARAYNGFDLYTESNSIPLPPIPDPQRLAEEARQAQEEALQERRRAQQDYEEIHYEEQLKEPVSSHVVKDWQIFCVIGFLLLLMLLLSFFMAKMIFLLRRGNKKR